EPDKSDDEPELQPLRATTAFTTTTEMTPPRPRTRGVMTVSSVTRSSIRNDVACRHDARRPHEGPPTRPAAHRRGLRRCRPWQSRTRFMRISSGCARVRDHRSAGQSAAPGRHEGTPLEPGPRPAPRRLCGKGRSRMSSLLLLYTRFVL